jgi:hypothetical protein
MPNYLDSARRSFGERASRRVPQVKYWRALVDGSEGVPEIEFRDLSAEDDAGDV